MYLTITAYDVLDQLHVRVIGMDTESDGSAEAITPGWRRAAVAPLEAGQPWADVVAFVAEVVLDLAFEQPDGETGNYR